MPFVYIIVKQWNNLGSNSGEQNALGEFILPQKAPQDVPTTTTFRFLVLSTIQA